MKDFWNEYYQYILVVGAFITYYLYGLLKTWINWINEPGPTPEPVEPSEHIKAVLEKLKDRDNWQLNYEDSPKLCYKGTDIILSPHCVTPKVKLKGVVAFVNCEESNLIDKAQYEVREYILTKLAKGI